VSPPPEPPERSITDVFQGSNIRDALFDYDKSALRTDAESGGRLSNARRALLCFFAKVDARPLFEPATGGAPATSYVCTVRVFLNGRRSSGLSIRPTIMRSGVPLILLLVVSAGGSFAQKKEMIQLQRDMAILQEQVRQTDRQVAQLGERMAVFETLLKQNLDTSTKLHQAVAVIERGISKQADAVVGPITSISTRVDSLSGQFGALRDVIEEMSSRMGKVQQQVEDIKNQVSTLPPPSMDGLEGDGMGGTSAETLFNSALTDYHRGTYESAEPQFQDYLKLYASTVRAAEAQFYLGAIAYLQENFGNAVSHFDRVLERYPVGLISADAQFKKGMALLKLSKTAEAIKEFEGIIEKFPNSTIAPAAEGQLEQLKGGSR